MKAITAAVVLTLMAGCQSLPESSDGQTRDRVFVSAQHCLEETVGNQDRIHFGPCLKITGVNGQPPTIRDDEFIELPVATALTLATTCVYRHADGSPIPRTVETADFRVTETTFTTAGQRWYLHAHKQARNVVGCQPTLSRSVFPTYRTD